MLVSLADFQRQAGAGAAGGVADQSFLDAAAAAVKTYCRRTLEAATRADYFDGTGVPELVLPFDWLPLNTVTEVKLDLAGGRGQKASTFGTDTVLVAGDDYTVDYAAGILRRERLTGAALAGWPGYGVGPGLQWAGLSSAGTRPAYWPRVPGCVKVSATTGYAGKAPADLQAAVIQLAAFLRRSQPDGGLLSASATFIDATESLAQLQADAVGALSLPAMGTVRQLLAAFREPVLAGGVR